MANMRCGSSILGVAVMMVLLPLALSLLVRQLTWAALYPLALHSMSTLLLFVTMQLDHAAYDAPDFNLDFSST
ncbi:hypothetical protein GOP47_0024372 [Adiantum capillus-veneris]|uniref:Uncharacterized protein n=1 Tax=Adiantum capillus-veneris TaxID=13818 RepID=A0A9D4U2J3_ADICA|nr:hypothetical protein GOP47_0024372 [Adiantum capillus-veneris]